MKRLILLVFSLLLLSFPQFAHADEGWVIDNFSSNLSILQTGEVRVDEKIDVDFNYLSKHGIYRDIPYIYERDGVKTYTEINVESILQNGSNAKYSKSLTNGYVRLKIGDANRTITGKNSYEIIYTAKGILRSFSDHDELYWNVTGNNWPVSISTASASVSIPTGNVYKTICYQGYSGSTVECSSFPGNPAKFNLYEPLSDAQGMTIAAGYKKGLVPILTVERPKTFWEKFTSWPSEMTLASFLIFGIGTVIFLWFKNGRDSWFGDGTLGNKDKTGSTKPIGAHETTVVEFTPPENLRPAEIGVLFDEKADTLDVTSTIIDLATRGYLTITEIPKKWVFGKVDYELKNLNKSRNDLLSYEDILLNRLFEDGDVVKISSLKNKFYSDLKSVKDALYRDVVSKKLFTQDPEKTRKKYYGVGILFTFLGMFGGIYTLSIESIFITDLCVGLLVCGIILLIFSRFMPKRTAYGRGLYRRIKGYRLFINTSEKYRQRFFEKKNLFNEVLPYAIVFGLTGKFAKAMEQIGFEPTAAATGWYVGTQPFNLNNFQSSVNSFSSSMSSAIASTPSSSGGFSGGGSGGGFGGGGGGSW